jgi:hypothetical protein
MKYLFLLALLVAPLCADGISLRDGEAFKFRVSWGIFGGAGEILVSAKSEELQGLQQLRVTTVTQTRGIIAGLYTFKAEAESVFDQQDGRLLAAKSTSTAKKKQTHSMSVFDYRQKVVHYVDYVRTDRTADVPLPAGSPMDLITTLIEARTFNMKPGDRRPAVVMFEKEFYEITIIAEKYEQVDTPWGERRTLVLKPVMEKDPKGIFKRGGDMHVWIAQDEKRLPVKFEVEMQIGTGVATLVDYTPPKTPPAPPAVASDAKPRS